MKLAVMQPYYFPYIGYYSLLHRAERFVIFDVPQYDRQGWMNRNRYLKRNGGWEYFHANTVKPPYKAAICDVMLGDDAGIGKLIHQIQHYRDAPYYAETIGFLREIEEESRPCKTLVELNELILRRMVDFLEIECEITVLTKMDLDLPNALRAGDWAIAISKAMGASEYVNPPGGRSLFDEKQWEEAGIDLKFLVHRLPVYEQLGGPFERGLSIVDVMMFNTRQETQAYLAEYDLLSAASPELVSS